jgi:hypothetical protein
MVRLAWAWVLPADSFLGEQACMLPTLLCQVASAVAKGSVFCETSTAATGQTTSLGLQLRVPTAGSTPSKSISLARCTALFERQAFAHPIACTTISSGAIRPVTTSRKWMLKFRLQQLLPAPAAGHPAGHHGLLRSTGRRAGGSRAAPPPRGL